MDKNPESTKPTTPTEGTAPQQSSSLTRRGFLRNGSAVGVGMGLIITSKTALGRSAQVSRNVIALAVVQSDNKALSNKIQSVKTEIERLLI